AQFRLGVSLLQIVHAVLFLDQAFHLLSEQFQTGIAIERVVPILQLSRFNRLDNVFFTQTKPFLCRFITERCPFLHPNGTVVCVSHGRYFPSMPQGMTWYFAHDHSIVMLERRGSHLSLYPQKLTRFALQHLGRGY